MQYLFKKGLLLLGVFSLLLLSCAPSKEESLKKAAAVQNQLCPVVIDSHTQLDSVSYTANDNTIHYAYSLLGDADDASLATQMRDELIKRIPDEIRRAAGLAFQREANVYMEYIYYSQRNGEELFRVMITPDMYQ